jgi:GrpB-like predicted nucleotidyltransferase (UPF0157 family)
MPSRAEIVSFVDSAPSGADPWVPGAAPAVGIEVTDPDPARPRQYDHLAGPIRAALGWRVLQLEHVGSTAVPGLAAKPVIDIDLTVADPRREQGARVGAAGQYGHPQAVSQHDRVGLFPNRIICLRPAGMLTPTHRADSRPTRYAWLSLM